MRTKIIIIQYIQRNKNTLLENYPITENVDPLLGIKVQSSIELMDSLSTFFLP